MAAQGLGLSEIIMTKIKLTFGTQSFTAVLENTPTVKKLLAALPVESEVETWGEEIYFDVGVQAELEPNATDVVDPGTVCFWVQGNSLAIPFGRTPASRGDESRLVTKVNILGKLEGDAKQLKDVKAGDSVKIKKV